MYGVYYWDRGVRRLLVFTPSGKIAWEWVMEWLDLEPFMEYFAGVSRNIG